MNPAIRSMLDAYGPIKGEVDAVNALREVMQRVTLLGLQRGGFFDLASFYGGTALRLLYGLDRFSEDLDFCLKTPDPGFSFQPFIQSILEELERFDLPARFEDNRSGIEVAIESAFVKKETWRGLLAIDQGHQKIHRREVLKIKLEVDKTNPPGWTEARKLILLPIPFLVSTLSESSLFAGKLHAILARSYLNRVKGRDFYDFVFYCARKTKLNLTYLEHKLRASGHYNDKVPLTIDVFIELLSERFMDVDYTRVIEDVKPFVSAVGQTDLKHWDAELFIAMAASLQVE